MNFLQRAGAILMLLAIFASSCNKYADDFTQINTKLDALATQVAGVTTLTTDISALKSQVTALQTSIAALPSATAQTAQFAAVTTALTAMDAKITALTTTLNTVAATGTATKAVVDGLKTDLAALAATVAANNTAAIASATAAMAKLTTNETAVAAIKTQLTAMGVADAALAADVMAIKTGVAANMTAIAANATALTAQAAQLTAMATQLTDNNTAINANNAAIAANLTAIAANSTSLANIATSLAALATTTAGSDAATAAAIAALQVSVTAQKTSLDQILANTSMYTGAVSIITDTDVDFFMLKLAQMNIINGGLTVNPTLITKTLDLATILAKITAVVGGNTVTLTAVAAKPIVLNNLSSISGTLTVAGGDLISQAAVDISKLSTVSGNFTYSLDGAISLPMLSSVGGNLTINSYIKTGTTILGTTSINLPLCNVVGTVALVGPGAPNLNDATSLVMPATGLASITATSATTVKVVNTAKVAAGFFVTAKSGAAVDLTGVTEALGSLTIGTGGVTVGAVNLSTLAKVAAASTVTVNNSSSGTVDLTAFNANVAVVLVGTKTVSMPAWVGGAASALTATSAETVTLAVHTWVWAGAPSLTAVKTLTVGAVNAAMSTTVYGNLETLNVTGKTAATWADLNGSITHAGGKLKSITVGGNFKAAAFTDNAAEVITSVTTSGVINSFGLVDADKLTSLTLGHTGYTSAVDGTPGALLSVTNCDLITSVTATNLDKVYSLTLSGNIAMTSFSFPALANVANHGVGSTGTFVINGNALPGSYADALLGPPYTEAVIHCAQLNSLKAYITTALTPATGYAAIGTLNLGWDKDPDGTGPVTTLAALMAANAANSAAVDAVGTVDQMTEVAIIQN